jgi:hypothetical protein
MVNFMEVPLRRTEVDAGKRVDDGGDSRRASEERESHAPVGSTPSETAEAFTSAPVPNAFCVLTMNSKGRWTERYLPSLDAASPGSPLQRVHPFGMSDSLLMEDSDNQGVDVQIHSTAGEAAASTFSFSRVGGILIAFQFEGACR